MMRKHKCLFYIAEYHIPFEIIVDEVYFLSKRPLGLTIFRFYPSPRVAYFKVATARRKILPAQRPFIEELLRRLREEPSSRDARSQDDGASRA